MGKYGFAKYTDEAKYSEAAKNADSFGFSVGVSKGVDMEKLGATAEVSLTLGMSQGTAQSAVRNVMKSMTESKEFSLGERLPDKGGVKAWVNQIAGEAMPFRYDLMSICEHPALSGKKQDCEKYSESYCNKHLSRASKGVGCQRSVQNECLWDLHCLPKQRCQKGTCAYAPICKITITPIHCDLKTEIVPPGFEFKAWKNCAQKEPKELGPFLYEDAPMGKVIDMKSMVMKVDLSDGCGEVIFMTDRGGCLEQSDKNKVWSAYGKDVQFSMNMKNPKKNEPCPIRRRVQDEDI